MNSQPIRRRKASMSAWWARDTTAKEVSRASFDDALDSPADAAGLRFAAVFAESLATLYDRARFHIRADRQIEPRLRRDLKDWQARFPIELPLGALEVFLTGWIRIYGMVCMEVFGHLRFALADGESMYEHEIQALAELISRPPAAH